MVEMISLQVLLKQTQMRTQVENLDMLIWTLLYTSFNFDKQCRHGPSCCFQSSISSFSKILTNGIYSLIAKLYLKY